MNAIYSLALVGSIAVFFVFILLFVLKLTKKMSTKDDLLTPVQLLTIGCFASIFLLFLPIYFHSYFEGESITFVRGIKTLFLAAHNTLRVFILDGDFDIIRDAAEALEGFLPVVYTVYSAVIYVVAPILTAGFVLSFFRGLNALLKYHTSHGADLFFISELTPDSYYLAKNIMEGGPLAEDIIEELEAKEKGIPLDPKKKKRRKRLVVFFDVYEQNEEGNTELISRVKDIGAIYFRRDITELPPHAPRGTKLKYYFIGQNEDENLQQCLEVMDALKADPRFDSNSTQLYVFSSTVESELLLNNAGAGKMKVRRINENRNLIIDTLLNDPIFAHAIPTGNILPDGTPEKLLSILIVGLGRYGTELLKALTWSGQMLGYQLKIHVVDKDPACEKRFRMLCPEIMTLSDRIKELGHPIPGESEYEIHFHTGVDIDTIDFYDVLDEIGPVTSAYCTLGQDEINIETAVYLRTYYGRRNQADPASHIPAINAVVYSTEKNEALCSASEEVDGERCPALRDIKGNDYGIRFIGNRRLRYTMRIIEQPALERQALKCHLLWGDTPAARASFNRFEYNRRSSIANAVHEEMRRALGLTLISEEGLTGEALEQAHAHNLALDILEHRRWNAFVRCEGYVAPAPARDAEGQPMTVTLSDGRVIPVLTAKDDMIKVHRDLVPFDDLPQVEKDKDRTVNKKK